MLNKKSFLAVDFGAVNLKLAEFELTEEGGLRLVQYGFKSLGQEGMQEATREPAMLNALKELLAERGFAAKNINVCAPGFHTFSKFVKLPPVDTSKVTQIIQYEAQQNVPFPLQEVVWDYQILGAAASGELEVLLVAIKSDIVEGLFRVAEGAGRRMQLVDVSPAALCNAFRFNYPDLEGCTMLLDIGAKTSNLLFFEKNSVYSRSINIGANSISLDFAKESKQSIESAEQKKIEVGFVSLGGAYEEPDDPQQAAISKIARQTMTRLHIQVNQTIQFYRGQQAGGAPVRLFLSGGAAIMPYTAQFFAEKLNVEVEYFNPLKNVEIDPALNKEELAKVAHSFGETVGLGLRNLAHCPVELNLMPASSLKRQAFNQRKPYFAAAAFVLSLVVWAFGMYYGQLAEDKQKHLEKLESTLKPLMNNEARLNNAMNDLAVVKVEADQLTGWLEERSFWARTVQALRESMRKIEVEAKNILKADLNLEAGLWVEKMSPALPYGLTMPGAVAAEFDPNAAPANNPTAPPPPRRVLPGVRPPTRAASGGAAPAVTGPREIASLFLHCRGIHLNDKVPAANKNLAFAVRDELAGRKDLFESAELADEVKEDEVNPHVTFTFVVKVKLKKTFKF